MNRKQREQLRDSSEASCPRSPAVDAVRANQEASRGRADQDPVTRLTEVVRIADRQFEQSGGSSRHWVRDNFLPALEDNGLCVYDAAEVQSLRKRLEDSERFAQESLTEVRAVCAEVVGPGAFVVLDPASSRVRWALLVKEIKVLKTASLASGNFMGQQGEAMKIRAMLVLALDAARNRLREMWGGNEPPGME